MRSVMQKQPCEKNRQGNRIDDFGPARHRAEAGRHHRGKHTGTSIDSCAGEISVVKGHKSKLKRCKCGGSRQQMELSGSAGIAIRNQNRRAPEQEKQAAGTRRMEAFQKNGYEKTVEECGGTGCRPDLRDAEQSAEVVFQRVCRKQWKGSQQRGDHIAADGCGGFFVLKVSG